MKLQILYHGNCFDGVLSAAIFTRFYQDRVDSASEVVYRAMSHGSGDPFGEDHEATFWADQNVVVDFRYSPSARLSWWCDHHQSTFIRPEHRDHFESRNCAQHFYDPTAPSCAGLLTRWLARDHGFDATPFADHVHWADMIDAARFTNAQQAVELAEPALQLMALLESAPDSQLVNVMITGLSTSSIEQVHGRPAILRALKPVLHQHQRTIDLFRRRIQISSGVAYVDLSADRVHGFNKFIPYALVPDIRYTVVLTHSSSRAKISVGSNPWNRPQPLINIAELCGRYGGGGHPVVGAVSLSEQELDSARRISLEIAEVLRRTPGAA